MKEWAIGILLWVGLFALLVIGSAVEGPNPDTLSPQTIQIMRERGEYILP